MNNKKCLITQNLIGAVDWCLESPATIIKPEKGGDGKTTWKEKAYNDLCNLVRRVKGDFPEAAMRGVKFENLIYTFANMEVPKKYSDEFKKVCSLVKGYQFGQKGKKTIEVDGNTCFLYGKYDAIKRIEKIRDVKTTANYKKGKYLKGIQHKLYCFMEGIDYFDYIIAEWDEYPKIKAIHIEEFVVEDKELLENEVRNRISECLENLKDLNLWDDYREKYCLY